MLTRGLVRYKLPRRGGPSRLWSHAASARREGTGGVVGCHVLQHVGCCLNRPLTNLVHADLVPAVFASHMSAACDVSGPDVYASSLRSIGGRCRGHWDSNLRHPRFVGRHGLADSPDAKLGTVSLKEFAQCPESRNVASLGQGSVVLPVWIS